MQRTLRVLRHLRDRLIHALFLLRHSVSVRLDLNLERLHFCGGVRIQRVDLFLPLLEEGRVLVVGFIVGVQAFRNLELHDVALPVHVPALVVEDLFKLNLNK